MLKKLPSAFIIMCLLVCLVGKGNVKAATNTTTKDYGELIITNDNAPRDYGVMKVSYASTPQEWTNLKILDFELGQTLTYIQKIKYNVVWYTDSKGVKRFHQITDVTSSITSYDDPFIWTHIKEWSQDSYSVYFTDNDTVAHISVTGKMIYNLPILSGEIRIKELFSTETWNIWVKFA